MWSCTIWKQKKSQTRRQQDPVPVIFSLVVTVRNPNSYYTYLKRHATFVQVTECIHLFDSQDK